MMGQASSQLIRRIPGALRMSQALMTSIADAQKALETSTSPPPKPRPFALPLHRTFDPRNSRLEKRLQLPCVEISPHPLKSMMVDRQHFITFMTRPSPTSSMDRPDVDSLMKKIESHSLPHPKVPQDPKQTHKALYLA